MNSRPLHAELTGNPNGPALLLLHGFLSSNAQWLPNREALEERHRLVLVELWGHGRSPAPADGTATTVEAYLEQFEHIRADLGVERWGLIGLSFGAGLMLHYALQHPARCAGVVITNSRSAVGALPTASGPRAGGQRAKARPFPAEADFDPRQLPFHPIHARRFPAQLQATLVRDADRVSWNAAAAAAALGPDLAVAHRLRDLQVPLLIVNGRHEAAFQKDLEPLRDRSHQIVDLEGGHSVNVEAAAEFNRAVLQFFASAGEGADHD